MSDTVAIATASSPIVAVPAEKKVPAKKILTKAVKKPSAAPTHPPTQQMVDASIKNLKERGGSSLLAIKKYISATYKCDSQKLAPFIKKYLKTAVASGKLIQTKGKGASGSFKLSPSAAKEPKTKVKSIEKKKTTTSVSIGGKKKSAATILKKSTALGSGEKKLKKTTAAVAAKKTAEKKKSEKINAKSVKKSGTIKAKPVKAKAATVPKPKVPKAKSTAIVAKPKKTTAAAPKKASSTKKTATKK